MKLTANEAQEIYACLTHKLYCVVRGDYRCHVTTKQDPELLVSCLKDEDKIQAAWVKDLKHLLKKMGVDGTNLQK